MVKVKNKKRYQPPLVDLLECRVERGFNGSLEGFTYGNSYNYNPTSSTISGPTPGGQAEGFSNGNSYDGAMFT